MKKVAIIFGGMSTEHEVSVVSGISVLKNINKEKYNLFPIYIDKTGNWYEYKGKFEAQIGDKIDEIYKIENPYEYLKKVDVVFPVLHGKYGEDGSIQGLLECLSIPYVGCGVLASSLGMDKLYAKKIFGEAGINQVKYCYIQRKNNEYFYINKNLEASKVNLEQIEKELGFPMFVKPANSGSSVGISKVKNKEELKDAIEYAAKFDRKIIIEENIVGKEIECAVLGNEEVKASCTGQVIPAEDFYSYEAKYKNAASKTKIPSGIEQEEEIKKLAIKAFKAIDGKGLARVDFFVIQEKIYLNEINTIPGFTNISMYAKLWEASGIPYAQLIDELIQLA